jgi:multisite-specific tRNA:(cytosine-C5)-methyltransferase
MSRCKIRILTYLAGQLKLVDVSDHLPELKRRPGLTSWKVATQAPASQDADKPLIWHDTFEEYEKKIEEALTEAEQNDKDKKRPLPASLWPPANANELNLERWYVVCG